MIDNIVNEYLYELDSISKHTKQLSEKFPDNEELVKDIYKAAIIIMCIKYESFTSMLFSKLYPHKRIKFNRPWFYTQEMAHKLKINLHPEYREVKECWDFYNTLKHINKKTIFDREKIKAKYKIDSIYSAFNWIYTVFVRLLNKFIFR